MVEKLVGHLRGGPGLTVFLALVTAVVVIAAASTAGHHIERAVVDVVYADTWGYVKLIGDLKSGEARFAEFFRPHNDNISPILCLALAASATFDHFNQRNICFLGLIFALLSLAILCAIAYRQIGKQRLGFAWAVCAIALTVTSLAQWENYLLSINFVFFSAITFSLASIYMTDRFLQKAAERSALGYFFAALLFSELALMSMAGGIAAGLVTSIQLVYGRFALKQGRLWCVGLYLAVVIASLVAFARAVHDGGKLRHILADPVGALEFFVIGTGNSIVGFFSNQPVLWLNFGVGLALLVIYVFVVGAYFRLPQDQRLRTLSLLSLILFGVVEQALIVYGRLPGGFQWGATSRYSTLTLVAPVGALIFVIQSSSTRLVAGVVSVLLGGAMIVLPVVADLEEMNMTSARREYGRDLQATLRRGNIQAEDATRLEWPFISDIVEGDAILRRYNLSLYAKRKAP